MGFLQQCSKVHHLIGPTGTCTPPQLTHLGPCPQDPVWKAADRSLHRQHKAGPPASTAGVTPLLSGNIPCPQEERQERETEASTAINFSNNQLGFYLQDLAQSPYGMAAEEVRYPGGYSSQHRCYNNSIGW